MDDQMKDKFLEENQEQYKKEIIELFYEPRFRNLAELSGQRFIKTHLPFKLLPPSVYEKKAKIVYVVRNPKDVVVSYYHLCRLVRLYSFVNDFASFFEHFINDLGKFFMKLKFRP